MIKTFNQDFENAKKNFGFLDYDKKIKGTNLKDFNLNECFGYNKKESKIYTNVPEKFLNKWIDVQIDRLIFKGLSVNLPLREFIKGIKGFHEQNYGKLGFKSEDDYIKFLKTPCNEAFGVAYIAEVDPLYIIKEENKIDKVQDDQKTIKIISVAPLRITKSSKDQRLDDNLPQDKEKLIEKIKNIASQNMKNILNVAKENGIEVLMISPIGLGVFLPQNQIRVGNKNITKDEIFSITSEVYEEAMEDFFKKNPDTQMNLIVSSMLYDRFKRLKKEQRIIKSGHDFNGVGFTMANMNYKVALANAGDSNWLINDYKNSSPGNSIGHIKKYGPFCKTTDEGIAASCKNFINSGVLIGDPKNKASRKRNKFLKIISRYQVQPKVDNNKDKIDLSKNRIKQERTEDKEDDKYLDLKKTVYEPLSPKIDNSREKESRSESTEPLRQDKPSKKIEDIRIVEKVSRKDSKSDLALYSLLNQNTNENNKKEKVDKINRFEERSSGSQYLVIASILAILISIVYFLQNQQNKDKNPIYQLDDMRNQLKI